MKEIKCQGEDCGRMAKEVDEDYYACYRCGWAGSENNPVVVLEKKIEELMSELRDCHDLLNDCGFFYEDGRWIDPQDDSEDLE
mgnify:FL=1|tara:strand:- start:46 stop:294 length:249 start_codon:yes stop_codon:yes gene_type:complete